MYKVIRYSENVASSILLFNGAKFNIKKIEKLMNEQAEEGYEMVFQIKERRRFFLFFNRETLIITFKAVE